MKASDKEKYSNIRPQRKQKFDGLPCPPGTQYFVVPGQITLSVVYGVLTKQQALKTESKAFNPSIARDVNILTAPAMAVFALILLVPRKRTTNCLLTHSHSS